MIPIFDSIVKLAGQQGEQNQQMVESQRQSLAGIYDRGQQPSQTPALQKFSTQNPDLASLASLMKKKPQAAAQQQQMIQPNQSMMSDSPFAQPTNQSTYGSQDDWTSQLYR